MLIKLLICSDINLTIIGSIYLSFIFAQIIKNFNLFLNAIRRIAGYFTS